LNIPFFPSLTGDFYVDALRGYGKPSYFGCMSELCIEERERFYSSYAQKLSNNANVFYGTVACCRELYKAWEKGRIDYLEKYDERVCYELRKESSIDVYYPFYYDGRTRMFNICVRGRIMGYKDNYHCYSGILLRLPIESVMSVRWYANVSFKRSYEEERKIIDVVYLRLNDWLSLSYIPHIVGNIYSPNVVVHTLSVYLNLIKLSKAILGIDTSNYLYFHDNFVVPYDMPLELFRKFVELNHSLCNGKLVKALVSGLWKIIFGDYDIPLVIRIYQLEYAFDFSNVEKKYILGAVHYVNSRRTILDVPKESKALKLEEKINEDYYNEDYRMPKVLSILTVSPSRQLKNYTKAFTEDGRTVERVEFIKSKAVDVNEFDLIEYIAGDSYIVKAYQDVIMVIRNGEGAKYISSLFKDLLRCKENCSIHEALLLEAFLSGIVRGKRIYSEIVDYYVEDGILRKVGRGRNSKYVLNYENPKVVEIVNKLAEYLHIEDLQNRIEEAMNYLREYRRRKREKKQKEKTNNGKD